MQFLGTLILWNQTIVPIYDLDGDELLPYAPGTAAFGTYISVRVRIRRKVYISMWTFSRFYFAIYEVIYQEVFVTNNIYFKISK